MRMHMGIEMWATNRICTAAIGGGDKSLPIVTSAEVVLSELASSISILGVFYHLEHVLPFTQGYDCQNEYVG